ncbi:MAG: hypothetical protein WDO15_15600 [Bacteroidota bacterium]
MRRLSCSPHLLIANQKKVFRDETINYSRLAEILNPPKWDTIIFEGVNFKGDLGERQWDDSVFGESTVSNAIKVAKIRSLEFNKCSFSESIFFTGNFEGNVALVGCKSPEHVIFEECDIKSLQISDLECAGDPPATLEIQ